MKLSIIIVNYNVKHYLEQCLVSVINALKGIESEIFVVDNNPDSPSGKAVKKFMENSVPNGRYTTFKQYKSNFVKERVFVEAW